MTESASAGARVWPRRVLALSLLAALAVAAVVAARTVYEQQARVQALEQALLSVQAQATTAADTLRREHEAAAALEARLARLEQSTAGADSRLHLQGSAAEWLLMAAAERLQVTGDATAATRLMEAADRRLAAAGDARLTPVREALAQERLALRSLEAPDRQGLELRLSALIRQAPQWPLRAQAPPAAVEPGQSEDEATWPRLRAAALQALRQMVSLRRDDEALTQSLGLEAQALVRQVLLLRLDGARLALLRGELKTSAAFCDDAAALLADHYRAQDAAIAAVRAELGELARLTREASAPVASGRALGLLRGLLD